MKSIYPKETPKGFALVVTLSLMILLTVIAVGLLTLSSVALRSSSQGLALAQARSNAKLALMLAIGELQKHAGPDQRITAPASILDATPETETLDKVGEPQVTGVWASNQQQAGSAPVIPNYDKPAAFRRWLVSGLDETEASQSTALSSSPFRKATTGVCLVGENTTKDTSDDSPSHLWAGKIAVSKNGHGAYAVMDEGSKARIDLTVPANMTAAEGIRSAAGAPLRNAFHLVRETQSGQGSALDGYHDVRKNLAKAITLDSAPLLKSGLPDLGPYFQDFTTDSAGVLADVSLGGLRKDLSLFGELAKIPSDYEKRRIYSNTDTPLAKLPSTPSYNGGAPDPHWNLVYDQLNVHKRLTGASGNILPTLNINPLFPALRPGPTAVSGAPAKSKFLAVSPSSQFSQSAIHEIFIPLLPWARARRGRLVPRHRPCRGHRLRAGRKSGEPQRQHRLRFGRIRLPDRQA